MGAVTVWHKLDTCSVARAMKRWLITSRERAKFNPIGSGGWNAQGVGARRVCRRGLDGNAGRVVSGHGHVSDTAIGCDTDNARIPIADITQRSRGVLHTVRIEIFKYHTGNLATGRMHGC